MTIPVAKPDIGMREINYVYDTLLEGWVSAGAPVVKQFEEKYAEWVGAKYAVATNTGTAALILALSAAGIREGDEVIVPEFTMIATAWAVSYVGATPVFVDCGDDLNIDCAQIEQKITQKTRAIMPVHIYGRPANMPEIMKIAYEYNLLVIEDAAESHGAEIDCKKVGAWGDMGCFSFMGNKIMTCGEGGIVCTNNIRLYQQAIHSRSMAFDLDHTFHHKKFAHNFRMPACSAAIGVAQLERIDDLIELRRGIAQEYDKYLGRLAIPRPKGSVIWFYDIVLNSDAEGCYRFLKQNGVESRVFFKSMSMQPMYKGDYENLKATYFANHGLYLPVYKGLTAEQIKFISELVLEYEQRTKSRGA